MKIKKGDTVKVIAGKDKGAEGKVIAVLPRGRSGSSSRASTGSSKHTKVVQGARGAKTGGIVTTEAPIHVSNVMLVDGDGKKPTRIKTRVETEATRRRLDVRRPAQRPRARAHR